MITLTSYDIIQPFSVNLSWTCTQATVAYYKIYRGIHSEDFELIAQTSSTTYSDVAIIKKKVTQDLYYKLEAYTAAHVLLDELVSQITSNDRSNYLKYRRWFETNFLKAINGAGHKVAMLQKRKYGEKCPICITATGEPSNPRCPNCYGTGITGGYHTPVIFQGLFGRFSVTAKENGVDNHFEIERTSFFAPPFPKLTVNDIIIDLDDMSRYSVTDIPIQYNKYNSTRLGSIAYELIKLPTNDFIYQYNINTQISAVTGVAYNATTGILEVSGSKLRPRYGTIYIVIWYQDADLTTHEELYFSDTLSAMLDTKITFQIDTGYTAPLNYRFVTNNQYFDGTAVVT